METSASCPICDGTDTNLIDGYYYCVECGTQDTTIMETVVERGVLQDGTYAVAGKRKITKKKVELKMSGEWYKWHAFNFIISGIADEIISLGASPSFKTKLLWIWMLYIKKFNDKKDYEKNNFSQQNTLLGSCLKDSDKEDDDDEKKHDDDGEITQIADESDDKQRVYDDVKTIKYHSRPDDPKKISPILYSTICSMIYCALNLDKSDIQASDILRFVREGRISFKTAIKYVPKDLKTSFIPHWRTFIKSSTWLFSLQLMTELSLSLYKQLDLGTPLVPNLGSLVTRYCKELCLPIEFRQLVMSLIELMPPEVCLDKLWRFQMSIPMYEGAVMAYIVVGLKMCFGLDDDYDQKLTYMVNEINDEENYVKAYKIGLFEPTDRLFSFGEWLKYLEFRKLTLCQYYQPMSDLHQVEINSCLVSEAIKDLKKNNKPEYRNKMAHDLLGKIPNNNDYKILPKEGFPSSLTPLTVYTEHVLLHATIEDPHIKLLLSEDFSKYSLSYACTDLKLHFSAASENVITGVAEINKDSGRLVKNSIKIAHMSKSIFMTKRSVFVKDAENNNVLGHYANVIPGFGDDNTLEMVKEDAKVEDPLKPMEIEEINTIAELDEEDNIFGVNFDAMENELQPNDSHSHEQLHIDGDDFNDEDRDETVLDLMKDIEYDPHMFNREDVIRNLILRYCSKYKIPIPFEYRDLSRVTRTTIRDANTINENKPRKPREVYSGELNSNNILKMYKKIVDTMTKEQAPTSIKMDELNDSIDDSNYDNRQNGNMNGNTDLPPDADLHIETTEEVTNTDGIDLAPTVEIQAPMDESDMLLNADVSGASLTETLEIVNDQAVVNEQAVDKNLGYEKNQNQEINDIIMSEIEKNTEQYKKGILTTDDRFTKVDQMPLARLSRMLKAKYRDRSHMTPFLKNPESVNKFNYNIVRHHRKRIDDIVYRTYSFEKEMLDNFSRSYRYILQTCGALVELHSYQLFRIVHFLEENFTKMNYSDIS